MQSRMKARWVFPVERPPIENGIVEIANGIITDVRRAKPQEVAEDLGDVAILPGLVNAHTHLEFSHVTQPFEPSLPFTSWIRSLMAYRREAFENDAAAKSAAIGAGWREAADAGTTLLGEIATDGWSLDATATYLPASGPRVVAFRELIGLRPESQSPQVEIAEQWLASMNNFAALSPHAPYSVALPLLAALVAISKERHVPVAMHLAETRAELEFLATGQGEFADMLRAFGAMPSNGLPTGLRPFDYLRALAQSPRALIVHGNYLAEDEIEFLAARPHMNVVYCPRTHEYFRHEPHPWRRMLDRGVNVAIGTDGRGSNPDLSVWNELVFLRNRFADVSPKTLLEMGTISGARALGFADDCGTLTPGKRADLVAVPVEGLVAESDPHELLFVDGQRIVETRFASVHQPEA